MFSKPKVYHTTAP